MTLEDLSRERVERLIKVGRMLGQPMTCAGIARRIGVTAYTVLQDRDLWLEFGEAALKRRLDELSGITVRKVSAPEHAGCVYLIASEGAVKRCGVRCRGQYCDTHQELVAPLGGSPCGAGNLLNQGKK